MVELTKELLGTPDLPLMIGKGEARVAHFEESLLGDDLFAGIAGSPALSLYPTSLPSFPCLADEMEEQAKAMEYDFLTEPQQAFLAGSSNPPAKTHVLPVPALRVSSFDPVQQQEMIPIGGIDGLAPATRAHSYAAATPAVLQQQQQHFSLVHHHQQQHHQQQQPRAILPPHQQSLPGSVQHRSAPLAAALHNADCIRSGIRSPWMGGWTGCRTGPWCNRECGHGGACNTRATIPGLGAYLPEELAAVGLPAVVELTAPLPPAAAAAALAAATAAAATLAAAGGTAAAAGDQAERGSGAGVKRKSAPASSGGSLTASDNNSNNGDEAMQQQQGGRITARTSKRKKAAADAGAAGETLAADTQEESGTDNEAASEEHKSSMTGEAKLRSVASLGKKGRSGRNGRKGQGGAVSTAAVHAVSFEAPVSSVPAPGAVAAAVSEKAPPRTLGRRAPQQWISGEATDPRSGKKVTVVPPATFCTQCAATSTPVWRAGPFGHKTLCNACGVRWMKVAPRARK